MKSRYIEPDELRKLLSSPNKSLLPLRVMLETGLRVGDTVALTWDQIDDSGRISYTAQKTGKQGTAQLTPLTLADLLARKRDQKNVFPSPADRNRHITRQAVWKCVKTAAKRAGIPPEAVSPHSFRKVFAVRLYQSEGKTAVMKALQHSREDTSEIYFLSDFTTGESGKKPLLRSDLPFLLRFLRH